MPLVNIDLAYLPISSVNVDEAGWMLGDSAFYTANTATALVNTANANLDGSGSLVNLITGGVAGKASFVKTVKIATRSSVAQGMIRLFVYNGASSRLLMEIEIFPMPQSSATLSGYEQTINVGFHLQKGYILKASTELADTYSITVEALDYRWE